MSELYELDKLIPKADEGVEVRFKKGGKRHKKQPLPLADLIRLNHCVDSIDAQNYTWDVLEDVLSIVKRAFPTASDELDSLTSDGIGMIVRIILYGNIDASATGGDAGNGSTAPAAQ